LTGELFTVVSGDPGSGGVPKNKRTQRQSKHPHRKASKIDLNPKARHNQDEPVGIWIAMWRKQAILSPAGAGQNVFVSHPGGIHQIEVTSSCLN
jgi:uncharacterized protein YigE (DUF2233 family)